ncbi:MAG TPA: hypothetical protein VFX49_21345, partial [Chloroflexota bacterium]|nr:hypothetical protein [Chloroflexota bacterium]
MLGLALAAEGAAVALLLALAVVGTLHLLPTWLLAVQPFTLGYGALCAAACLAALRRYAGWRRARPVALAPPWVRAAVGTVLAPLLAVALIGAVVYLKVPFWPAGADAAAAPDGQRPHSIYLVKHTWHTSVSVRLEDLGAEGWPDPVVRGRTWVDFGWGDEG